MKRKINKDENSEEDSDENADNKKIKVQNDIQSEESSNKKSEERKSLIEIIVQRNNKLEELKNKIAILATSIIGDPERNIKKLRELLTFFDIKVDDEEYSLVFLSLQKLVAFSLLEVFKDVLPNYRLKEKINEEDEKMSKSRSIKLKRDTKRLRDYERSLLQLYRLYLMRLERMIQCISKGKSKKSNFYDSLPSKKAKTRIATIGTKCLTDLLISHANFNFADQLIDMIVNLMGNNHYKDIANMCVKCVTRVYKEDKLGEVSLKIVKSTSKLIKARNNKINPDVIRTFLGLKIKEIIKKDEPNKKDMSDIRAKMNKMSKREKKRNKKMQKLENQLLEVEAEESYERKLKFHTEILTQIFATFFRILRDNIIDDDEDKEKWFKLILSPVLEGLSKFAHLINYQFFDDLINILHKLIQSGRIDDYQCLHCLQTIFVILSGEGCALNIDPQQAYKQFYLILINIDLFSNQDIIKVLLMCISSMIIKRKKQISHQRVLAFIKRLSTICQQLSPESVIAILNSVRHIMINHKQSDVLLDSDICGSGVFVFDCHDPEYCNANSTLLWELLTLRKHYHPSVVNYANYILNGCKGVEMPIDLVKKTPLELFEELEATNHYDLSLEEYKKNYKNKIKIDYNKILNSDSDIAKIGCKLLSTISDKIGF